ncbi:MAG: carboxylesterase family protein, partial [Proteobacteria bacterium]|nr:carboxylesterase family protein [Pseudomonadota bacterium]
ATERTTENGRVVGFLEDNGGHTWLGVPFAKPPVGDLRWKAPLPAENWTETRQALKLGPVCSQIGGLLGRAPKEKFGKPIGSEDCLFVNIWAPGFAPDKIPQGKDRLPVMVWIHGGGNSIGFGGENGKVLATKYKVIVATFNYRLGPLGWFVHPSLRGEGTTPEDRSGNYGTLDNVRALTWVRDNIANFGGDPGNVTVFGESAGGTNTMNMMLSPKAKGLFHRAIVQSGGSATIEIAKGEDYKDAADPGHTFSSREIINQLLINDGTAADRNAAKSHQDKMSSPEIARYLYGKTPQDILPIYRTRAAGMLDMPKIFRDGTVLPRNDPMEVIKDAENYNAIPVILGTNRDEYRLFMAQDPKFVDTYFGIYRVIKDETLYKLASHYSSGSWKARGVDEPAGIMREAQGASVYAYRFDWDEEPSLFGVDMSLLLGAAHGLEIPFVFNEFKASFLGKVMYSEENAPGRIALSDSMSSYWTEFAYTGSPGKGRNGKQIEWKPWDNRSAESEKFIIFDTSKDRGIRMSSDVLTLEKLKEQLLSETGFASQEDHCRAFATLFGKNDLWNELEYEKLGREGCAAYPKAGFQR